MGAAAGMIPCPSALVVLLGAIAQGQIALGMLLIVAFSAGLAATLTVLGPRGRSRRPGAQPAPRPRPADRGAPDALGAPHRRRRPRSHGASGAAGRVMPAESDPLLRVVRKSGTVAGRGSRRQRSTVTVPHRTPPLEAPLGRRGDRPPPQPRPARLVGAAARDRGALRRRAAADRRGDRGRPRGLAAGLRPRVGLPQPRHARGARPGPPLPRRPRPRALRARRRRRPRVRHLRALRRGRGRAGRPARRRTRR